MDKHSDYPYGTQNYPNNGESNRKENGKWNGNWDHIGVVFINQFLFLPLRDLRLCSFTS